MFHADFLCFTLKIVEHSRYLLPGSEKRLAFLDECNNKGYLIESTHSILP